jgi:hypothetical protein
MLRGNAETILKLVLNAPWRALKLDMVAIVGNIANPLPLSSGPLKARRSRAFFERLRNEDAIQMRPSNITLNFQMAITTRACAPDDTPILSIIETKGISSQFLPRRPALEGRLPDTT